MRLFLWRRVNSIVVLQPDGGGWGWDLTGSSERRGKKHRWNRCESSGRMRGELTGLLVPVGSETTGRGDAVLKSCWPGGVMKLHF